MSLKGKMGNNVSQVMDVPGIMVNFGVANGHRVHEHEASGKHCEKGESEWVYFRFGGK